MRNLLGRHFGRFFLVLFVWLQCLAPLLHAHAGGTDHFGLHLPEDVGMLEAGQHAFAPHKHHAGDMHAIGVSQGNRVDPALQAFADPPDAAISAPLTISIAQPVLAAFTSSASPPPSLSRLLPLPGAPPSR
ncbi:MAG: hypothetical protein AB1831_00595 [Pseudomonadota bacterium]